MPLAGFAELGRAHELAGLAEDGLDDGFCIVNGHAHSQCQQGPDEVKDAFPPVGAYDALCHKVEDAHGNGTEEDEQPYKPRHDAAIPRHDSCGLNGSHADGGYQEAQEDEGQV